MGPLLEPVPRWSQAPRHEWPPRCWAALLPRGFFPLTLPDSHHESPDVGGIFEGRVTSSCTDKADSAKQSQRGKRHSLSLWGRPARMGSPSLPVGSPGQLPSSRRMPRSVPDWSSHIYVTHRRLCRCSEMNLRTVSQSGELELWVLVVSVSG